jgi:hypothetical protein
MAAAEILFIRVDSPFKTYTGDLLAEVLKRLAEPPAVEQDRRLLEEMPLRDIVAWAMSTS